MLPGDFVTTLSAGCGVGTTALAVLNAEGIVTPRAEVAIFADTWLEWPETYHYISQHLRPYLERAGIRFVSVCAGNLYEDLAKVDCIPFVYGGCRECTQEYKLRPIYKWLRYEYPVGRDQVSVIQQIAFTADESDRVWSGKPFAPWAAAVYPMVDLGITRYEAMGIIHRAGLPIPPKSRCWLCPFQNRDAWRLLSGRHPALYDLACDLEESCVGRRARVGKSPIYLTNAGRPLRDLFGGKQGVFVMPGGVAWSL
jgi:hypothetical protein